MILTSMRKQISVGQTEQSTVRLTEAPSSCRGGPFNKTHQPSWLLPILAQNVFMSRPVLTWTSAQCIWQLHFFCALSVSICIDKWGVYQTPGVTLDLLRTLVFYSYLNFISKHNINDSFPFLSRIYCTRFIFFFSKILNGKSLFYFNGCSLSIRKFYQHCTRLTLSKR